MNFKLFFLFLISMVHVKSNVKRTKKTKTKERASSSETESVDSDQFEIEQELLKTPTTDKGKAPMPAPPESKKRKIQSKKKGKLARNIIIEEAHPERPSTQPRDYLVSNERINDFKTRECIGERHVSLGALRSRSEAFGEIVELANLSPICTFPERTGYCAHLVRTFFTNARQLQEIDNGPMEFVTTVRGTQMTITPRVIGEVVGLRPSMTGTHYLKGRTMTTTSWQNVLRKICVPNTSDHGIFVLSKDLLPEYRFLNFIICYNIQPNMNTKVLRWDRMLLMYLLGHPSEGVDLNFNIPYLIWSRMARYVEHTHVQERLPFPLIIMRILRKFKVDTRSTSYQYSLGTINDSTVVKSLPRMPEESPSPPRRRGPSASRAPRQAAFTEQGPSSTPVQSTSDEDASVTSIYREQQRLSSEQERISQSQAQINQNIEKLTSAHDSLNSKYKSLKKMLKKLMEKMGCTASDDSSDG